MKALFLCFIIAISLSLDLILINIIENSSFQFKFYISSLILISITIFLIAVEAILWLFNFSEKVQTGIISINFMINISKSTYFCIAYFINNSISSSVVILSFLTFVISIIIGLINIKNNSSVEPVSTTKEQINIDLKTVIFTLEEPLSCVICLDEFIKEQEVNITPCNHFLHTQCMKELLNNKIKNCPICRRDLDETISTYCE